jgi:hypothetical protein
VVRRLAISGFLVSTLFAAAVFVTYGQTAPTSGVVDTYAGLLEKLNSGDTKIDFTRLRVLYSETKDASPYGSSHETRREMNNAVAQRRCPDAIRIADEILKNTYLSPDAHIAKSVCYAELGEARRAEFHKAIYLGLINSILASGDGGKPETAYVVVTIEEEYAVMRALGFTVWAQAITRLREHTFELLSGTNEKTGQTARIYFNLDRPAALLRPGTARP